MTVTLYVYRVQNAYTVSCAEFVCIICVHVGIGDTMRICGPWILATQNPSQCGRVYHLLLRVPLWTKPMVQSVPLSIYC